MPETSSAVLHSGADRCPGVLRLAEAADGLLGRVRLPGGLVDATQLRVLAGLAGEFGDGRLELTSRGNVQLRGLRADAAWPLTGRLVEAGLLPSLAHDRVRNVLASPLAGLDGGPGLTGLVRALDAALCVRPRLAELSGRFLFAVDDGRGDVAGLGADVVATVRPDGADVNGLAVPAVRQAHAAGGSLRAGSAQAHAAGRGSPVGGAAAADTGDRDVRDRDNQRQGAAGTEASGGPDGPRDRVVAAMLAFAEAFLDLRAEAGGTAWRVADLPEGAERVRAAVAARLGLAAAATGPACEEANPPGRAGPPWVPGGGPAVRPVGLIPVSIPVSPRSGRGGTASGNGRGGAAPGKERGGAE